MLPIAILRMKPKTAGSGETLTGADYAVSGAGVAAVVTLNNDGTVTTSNEGGTVAGTPWLAGTTPDTTGAALFEVFSHKDSGTSLGLSQPTQDTWLPLSTSRTWSATTNGVAARNGLWTVQIREIANTANTVTISISVDSSP